MKIVGGDDPKRCRWWWRTTHRFEIGLPLERGLRFGSQRRRDDMPRFGIEVCRLQLAAFRDFVDEELADLGLVVLYHGRLGHHAVTTCSARSVTRERDVDRVGWRHGPALDAQLDDPITDRARKIERVLGAGEHFVVESDDRRVRRGVHRVTDPGHLEVARALFEVGLQHGARHAHNADEVVVRIELGELGDGHGPGGNANTRREDRGRGDVRAGTAAHHLTDEVDDWRVACARRIRAPLDGGLPHRRAGVLPRGRMRGGRDIEDRLVLGVARRADDDAVFRCHRPWHRAATATPA